MMMKPLTYWRRTNRLCLISINDIIKTTTTTTTPTTSLLLSRGPGFLKSKGLFSLLDQQQLLPTAQELFDIVEDAYVNDERKTRLAGIGMGESDEGVVFSSGYGDPLSRLDIICEAATMIKESRHGIPLTLLTCGVNHNNSSMTIKNLQESGIDFVSLFFPSTTLPHDNPHMREITSFASQVVEEGLTLRGITVSMTSNTNINTKPNEKAVKDLLMAIGAVEFEIKSFVP
jgi:hypothetical protein